MTETLSRRSARLIALAAQGFGAARPPVVNAGHLRRTVERLALHQIDSVNVLVRAHYLPAFSRLGNYDRGLLDRAAWGPKRERRLFEYWAHEASLLPVEYHPWLRWRMEEADRGEIGWRELRRFATEKRPEAMAILDRIRSEGPVSAADFEEGRSRSGWWEWGDTKRALEWLFWAGHITTAKRRGSFARLYDLTERVIPPAIFNLPTPSAADAHRFLIAHSAQALGVATAGDLRDYFRLSPAPFQAALATLVEDGTLLPVKVEGWSQSTYLHRDARRPRKITGQALLAPFDPLVWERSRAERLFGFRYRIEIYVPAEKRLHGYYVLPFLMDDQLVARVDLKAGRQAGRLLVQNTHIEDGAPTETAERLAEELRLMAQWLALEPAAT